MPIIWRYLIGHFLGIAAATVTAFIAILLTMRLDEIARVISLGAPLKSLLLFVFHQMFYVLPIAIPLACLIASFILIQGLSKTHELTALRSCGFALRDILAPILFSAAFLSILNFWVISELATNSHLQTNLLKSELRSVNPLCLLHNTPLMQAKGFYLDAWGPVRVGEFASDIVLAIPHKKQQRLSLFMAKKVSSAATTFNAEKVTLLTSFASGQEEGFDDLLIENINEAVNQTKDFSAFLQNKVWNINNDYLRLPLLLIRAHEQKVALQEAKSSRVERSELKKLKAQLSRSLSEITKRISIALAVFSFTLMGAAFGMSISRQKNSRSLYGAIFLTTLYLVSFFVARGVDHNYVLANLFYLVPHGIIIIASLGMLIKAGRGIE